MLEVPELRRYLLLAHLWGTFILDWHSSSNNVQRCVNKVETFDEFFLNGTISEKVRHTYACMNERLNERVNK